MLWSTHVAAQPGEHWYRSSVDHYLTRYHALVLDGDRGLAVRRLDLIELGLPVPPKGTEVFHYQGEVFYPLSSLPDLRLLIDHDAEQAHFQRRGLSALPTPPNPELLLTVALNGQPPGDPVLVRFRAGHFHLDDDGVRALGLDPARLPVPGPEGYTLSGLAGARFTVDVLAQSLTMTVPPGYFVTHHLNAGHTRPAPLSAPVEPSVMLDYSITEGGDGERRWRSGTVDAALGWGDAFCESRHAYQSWADTTLRLGSRCVWNQPDRLLSVSLGDAVSDPAVLGQPVRYGGVRIGTDYGLAPSFATQPYLSLEGSARVPSVLEIWTDQMLNERREIPPGPFRIDDLPAYTGAGNLRAVVRDGSGQPLTIVQPFYSDPALLARGLSDWSLEYGYQRRDPLSADAAYDRDPFAALTARHGVRDWLTLGVRGEHFDTLDLGAAEARLRLGRLGVLELGGAASDGPEGGGEASVIGFSRRGRWLSLGWRQWRAGQQFVSLGYPLPGEAPALQRQSNLGLVLGRGVSLSLGRVERRYHDDRDDQVFDSAGLTLSLAGAGQLLMSVFQPRSPSGDRLYTLAFTLPLGWRGHATAAAGGADLEDRTLSWQRNPPAGPGTGYRARVGTVREQTLREGDVTAQNRYARLRLYGRRLGEQSSGYGELSGALIANRAGLFASRSRPGGVAVVDAGASDVRVYRDNHLMGRTGAKGKLVVAGLLPYQQNSLRLAPEDLPLDARLASDRQPVVTGQRQALTVSFPVRRDRPVSVRLTRTDGRAVPAGASAELNNRRRLVVGHGGLVYAPLDQAGGLSGTARWDGGACDFTVTAPADADYPLDLGAIPCHSDPEPP
ncbi:fimbria/pilus outer membrane usher protein [Alloalcanivorax sp. C16-2]|uniref:fimbria/pilus outer membrane usher protein n=1 Tax=Alloalcanivorax sp. C16-2 TaxID=3390052 RepID=UPI003970BEC4